MCMYHRLGTFTSGGLAVLKGWDMSVLLKVVAGNSCPDLAAAVCKRLDVHISPSTVTKFMNNETHVQIG